MNKRVLGFTVVIILLLAAVGVAAYLVSQKTPQQVPVEISTEPTNFMKEGVINFSNISTTPSEPFLSYQESGQEVSKKLILDALSVCAAPNGATACMAMSVTLEIPFGGKRATVEGVIQADGTILVRKLQVLAEGEQARILETGRVFVPWQQARMLIQACQVEMALQTHSLDVNLTLKDGRKVVAVEPVIDEVFRVVHETNSACGNIGLGTE